MMITQPPAITPKTAIRSNFTSTQQPYSLYQKGADKIQFRSKHTVPDVRTALKDFNFGFCLGGTMYHVSKAEEKDPNIVSLKLASTKAGAKDILKASAVLNTDPVNLIKELDTIFNDDEGVALAEEALTPMLLLKASSFELKGHTYKLNLNKLNILKGNLSLTLKKDNNELATGSLQFGGALLGAFKDFIGMATKQVAKGNFDLEGCIENVATKEMEKSGLEEEDITDNAEKNFLYIGSENNKATERDLIEYVIEQVGQELLPYKDRIETETDVNIQELYDQIEAFKTMSEEEFKTNFDME